MLRLLAALLYFLPLCCAAQTKTDTLLVRLLANNRHPLFQQIISNPSAYRIQIIYTQINRDKKNRPTFTHYFFNENPHQYYYPASVVKMPLAFLALEKLNDLKKTGINKHTPILFDSSRTWHTPLHRDSTSLAGVPTIAHFIKRAFLISENDPYNRLYQFLGQENTNRRLHQLGYTEARITRQFLGLTPEQNRITNPYRFVDPQGKTIYSQPELVNKDSFDFSHVVKLGEGYMNRNDSLIREPFDFTRQNNLSLFIMQQLLQSVLFPQSVPHQQRLRLSSEDQQFLRQYLSQYPSETTDPKYDTTTFYDSYVKFFFRDSTRRMPPHVRVFNKVGWSYGFLTDVSYVVDVKNRVEYMLAATVYVNSDGVLNDDKYDYDSMGYPFLYQLGQTIYRYELERKRTHRDSIPKWPIRYGQRNLLDKRPSLKEVDN